MSTGAMRNAIGGSAYMGTIGRFSPSLPSEFVRFSTPTFKHATPGGWLYRGVLP